MLLSRADKLRLIVVLAQVYPEVDVHPGFKSGDNVSISVKSTTLKKEDFAMRQSRYTSEQIAFALRQAEFGITVKEVIRKMEICEQAFNRWP